MLNLPNETCPIKLLVLVFYQVDGERWLFHDMGAQRATYVAPAYFGWELLPCSKISHPTISILQGNKIKKWYYYYQLYNAIEWTTCWKDPFCVKHTFGIRQMASCEISTYLQEQNKPKQRWLNKWMAQRCVSCMGFRILVLILWWELTVAW